MECSDIMLSVVLHAGLVAGVMYGISHYESEHVDNDIVEPVFFEILEESVIAAASGPTKPDDPAPPVPKEEPRTDGPEEPEPVAEAAEEAVETVTERNPPDPEPLPPEPLPEPPSQKTEEPVEDAEQETLSPEQAAEPETAPQADQETAKVVSAPVACARIVPRYPRSARRRGREGAVTLDVSVSDSGDVSAAEVVVSSGHEDLDEAAVSAVRSARFAPATEDGVSVDGSLRLTFEFKLR